MKQEMASAKQKSLERWASTTDQSGLYIYSLIGNALIDVALTIISVRLNHPSRIKEVRYSLGTWE